MDGGAGFGDGMGGFAEMPRPLIEKLIEQVLREMLGGGALKQMVAGMLGTSPATSTVAPVVGDEVLGKGKARMVVVMPRAVARKKKGRWRQGSAERGQRRWQGQCERRWPKRQR